MLSALDALPIEPSRREAGRRADGAPPDGDAMPLLARIEDSEARYERGDALGRLWAAPRTRVVSASFHAPLDPPPAVGRGTQRPVPVCHICAAVDAAGWPTAWLQLQVEDAPPQPLPRPIPYAIAHQSIRALPDLSQAGIGWRCGDAPQRHAFCREVFVDELAQAARCDPLHYRRQLALDVRMRRLLDRAAEHVDRDRPVAAGAGRGVAFGEWRGVPAAVIVEATLGADGRARVSRLLAVFGDDAAHPVRTPLVEADRLLADGPLGGLGATGLPAAAMANALGALTGRPPRALPVRGAAGF